MPATSKNTGVAGSRAKSTSQLSQSTAVTNFPPPVHPSLAGFNDSNDRFAAINAGLGASEKLRIWDTGNSTILGEWDAVPEGNKSNQKVKSLVWGSFFAEDLQTSASDSENRKKRRKRRSEGAPGGPKVDAVVLAQGSDLLFYTSTSNVVVKRVALSSTVSALGWTSQQDGFLIAITAESIHVFDSSATQTFTTGLPAPIKSTTLTSVSVLPPDNTSTLSLILASNSITKLDVSLPISEASSATFGMTQQVGVESIRKIVPLNAQRFVIGEEQSRVASIWRTSDNTTTPFDMVASVPIPVASSVHTLTASPTKTELFVLAETGEISVFSVSEAALSASAGNDAAVTGKKAGARRRKTGAIPSLQPISKIAILEGKEARQSGLISFAVSSSRESDDMDTSADVNSIEDAGELIVGRMGGASRVKWEKITFRDAAGAILPEVNIKRSVQDISGANNDASVPLQRFRDVDRPQTSVNAIAADEEQALVRQDMDLPVEGDMADLTLGERLALQDPGSHANNPTKAHASNAAATEANTGNSLGPQNAQSLTRLLLQALHTSDPQLLSMILTSPSNASPTLIRNTIRKLPSSMALPLLKACVDRLGKGKAFNKRGGGRGGGLNEKQGLVVVAWIRGVLVERGNVLMTIPSLPAHLASLSSLLNDRLQLYTPLLSLSGRLDLALAQIDARKALLAAEPHRQGNVYIEGESDDDDDDSDDDDEVEIEQGGDEGEIEDIRIESRRDTDESDDETAVPKRKSKAVNGTFKKGKSVKLDVEDDVDELADDDDEDEDDEDEDDFDQDYGSDESEGAGGPGAGFIDDEAEEASEDESDDEMEG
ncbi:hypothetical protein QFC22_004175 [Naganishia vaughanmartiniae]|uniref:Uncharacterized protein n=1 Tax=Naganishia vaughanmartiniae TaxID=1424756 RepID=A0ACC2X4C0_9TREE|nr:hypothetical protein QFC22_004175 [Naganishia vaughanmartiniae]